MCCLTCMASKPVHMLLFFKTATLSQSLFRSLQFMDSVDIKILHSMSRLLSVQTEGRMTVLIHQHVYDLAGSGYTVGQET